MKRLVCLLLVVLIACAGCYDVEIDKLTDKPVYDTWAEDLKSNSELRLEIVRLERDLRKAKTMSKQNEALQAKIAELESSLKSQRAKLVANIAKLKTELAQAKAMPRQDEALLVMIAEIEGALECQRVVEMVEKALLARIDELEAAIESPRAVEREQKVLLARIDELEAAIESQRAEIENSKNIYRVYEVTIESQKLTIETLQKLCRLYEAEVDQNHNTQSDKATNHKKDSVHELSQTPVSAER